MFVIVVGKRSFTSKAGNPCNILDLISPHSKNGHVGFQTFEKYVGKSVFDSVDVNFGYHFDVDLTGLITKVSEPVADLEINLYD